MLLPYQLGGAPAPRRYLFLAPNRRINLHITFAFKRRRACWLKINVVL